MRRPFANCSESRCLAAASIFLGLLLLTACTRSAPREPPKPPPPPLEYLGEWGVKGDGPGQLAAPVRIATDRFGNAYIADFGSGFVHKFSLRGEPLLSFQDERLKKPVAIALDEGSAIYVADAARRSLLIFLPDGTRYREIQGGAGFRFRMPTGVAVDIDGNIYVADREGNFVLRLNPRGRFLKSWGGKGRDRAEMIAPEDVAVGPDGFVYVLDDRGTRVQKFTRDGDLVCSARLTGASPGVEAGPGALAVSEKYVFVADGSTRRVAVWTLDCQARLNESVAGRLPAASEQRTPTGVAVAQGELLVLDPTTPRVLRFRINF